MRRLVRSRWSGGRDRFRLDGSHVRRGRRSGGCRRTRRRWQCIASHAGPAGREQHEQPAAPGRSGGSGRRGVGRRDRRHRFGARREGRRRRDPWGRHSREPAAAQPARATGRAASGGQPPALPGGADRVREGQTILAGTQRLADRGAAALPGPVADPGVAAPAVSRRGVAASTDAPAGGGSGKAPGGADVAAAGSAGGTAAGSAGSTATATAAVASGGAVAGRAADGSSGSSRRRGGEPRCCCRNAGGRRARHRRDDRAPARRPATPGGCRPSDGTRDRRSGLRGDRRSGVRR